MEQKGLTVSKVRWDSGDAVSLSHAIMPRLSADVVLLESLLQEEQLKLLYTVSDAVLANSVVEPFGLVGLETMAAGGIAAVGATGEDYVTNGYDAISLQTDDVREFVRYVARLKNYKGAQQAMRAEARKSAARYTWRAVIERALLPFVREIGFEVGDAGDDGAASDSSPAPQGVASGRTNGVRLDPS
jgi:glycosyltransferase involved in cell wall biosynthesis